MTSKACRSRRYVCHGAALLIFVGLWGASLASAVAAQDEARVARAMFTTKVENREPINRVLVLKNSVTELFFFSDLRHMQGETITHRWEYDGKTVMTKSFDVRGPRWRVYSKKDIEPQELGRWTVVITDKNGWPLKAVVFRYIDESDDTPEVILPPGPAQ